MFLEWVYSFHKAMVPTWPLCLECEEEDTNEIWTYDFTISTVWSDRNDGDQDEVTCDRKKPNHL